jgi:hypothetical protein
VDSILESDSILTSVKRMCGVDEADINFDLEIITHINTALLSLNQLGVGPTNGFMITSKSENWYDLLGVGANMIAAKTFVYLKVRLVFDPPTSSFVVDAMERQVKELEWRLNVQAEKTVIV